MSKPKKMVDGDRCFTGNITGIKVSGKDVEIHHEGDLIMNRDGASEVVYEPARRRYMVQTGRGTTPDSWSDHTAIDNLVDAEQFADGLLDRHDQVRVIDRGDGDDS